MRPACLAIFMTMLLIGCETYPLGMSKSQWMSLTPQQQADATAEQARLNTERRTQQEAAQREQRRIDARRSADYEREIALRRHHARYGDIVSVLIEDGQVQIRGKHRPYRPIAFDLVRGESRVVTFHRIDKPYFAEAVVSLSDDARTFAMDVGSRHPVRLIDKQWERGQTHTFNARDKGSLGPDGVMVTLRYRRLREPHRLEIERQEVQRK